MLRISATTSISSSRWSYPLSELLHHSVHQRTYSSSSSDCLTHRVSRSDVLLYPGAMVVAPDGGTMQPTPLYPGGSVQPLCCHAVSLALSGCQAIIPSRGMAANKCKTDGRGHLLSNLGRRQCHCGLGVHSLTTTRAKHSNTKDRRVRQAQKIIQIFESIFRRFLSETGIFCAAS